MLQGCAGQMRQAKDLAVTCQDDITKAPKRNGEIQVLLARLNERLTELEKSTAVLAQVISPILRHVDGEEGHPSESATTEVGAILARVVDRVVGLIAQTSELASRVEL